MSARAKNSDDRRPTRRTFVTYLGAVATALVLRPTLAQPEPERPQSPIPTRWIGHI